MSASSGRDPLLNAELESDLDGKGFKIKNTDFTGTGNTFPTTVGSIAHTANALKGDNNGNAIDSKVSLVALAANQTVIHLGDSADYTLNGAGVTISADNGASLQIGAGGTLGTAAFTATGAYANSVQGAAIDSATNLTGILLGTGGTPITTAVAKTNYWDLTTVVNGGSHTKGLAPDPGSGSGTTKFLREDGTWNVPPASSGVTIANTTNVIKGDNAGGGVAATPGTDYQVPSTALTRLLASTSTITSGTTITANWALSASFTLTLGHDVATTNFTNATDGWEITVEVINAASHTIVWGNSVKWPNGGPQPTASVSSKTDLWGFKKIGSIIYGAVLSNMHT